MTRLPRDRLAALRPEDVEQYLRSHGWLLDSSGTSDKAVSYHYPGQADAEVLVPRRREVTDYAARLADVVQVLSALEERTVWEVINDVSGPPADILRLAVATANAALGSLPLNEGIKLIEGGRSLLLAAACSVHSPQPFYPRRAFREAVEFLDTCRLVAHAVASRGQQGRAIADMRSYMTLGGESFGDRQAGHRGCSGRPDAGVWQC